MHLGRVLRDLGCHLVQNSISQRKKWKQGRWSRSQLLMALDGSARQDPFDPWAFSELNIPFTVGSNLVGSLWWERRLTEGQRDRWKRAGEVRQKRGRDTRGAGKPMRGAEQKGYEGKYLNFCSSHSLFPMITYNDENWLNYILRLFFSFPWIAIISCVKMTTQMTMWFQWEQLKNKL